MSAEKTNKKVKMESSTIQGSNETTTPSNVNENTAPPAAENGEKKLGRPVDTLSKRQKVLLEKAIKEKQGIVARKGRPVSADSKRQQTEKEKAEKRANGELKPGRPKFTPEQKAEADAKKAAKKAKEMKKIQEMANELIQTGKAEEILAEVEGNEVTANVTETENINS